MPDDSGAPVQQMPQRRYLRDIKVPQRFYNRHLTGFETLDVVFGGEQAGVLPGGAYLVTGMPGAGKTTLLLQMIDAYTSFGNLKVLFNIGEESPYQVKMAADRIGVKGDFLLETFDDVNALMAYAVDEGVDMIVQDSLQSLTDIDQSHLHSERLWLEVGKKLIEMSKDFTITSFIVGHVTKGGEIRGKNELVHDADAHIHITLNRDTGNRIVELRKNRFGPAQMPYQFTLDRNGINLQRQPDGTTVDGTRNVQRRQEVMDIIRSLLLRGVPLNGYSAEPNGADAVPELVALGISGGGMRGYLRQVEATLQAEGVLLVNETIAGRRRVRVDVSS